MVSSKFSFSHLNTKELKLDVNEPTKSQKMEKEENINSVGGKTVTKRPDISKICLNSTHHNSRTKSTKQKQNTFFDSPRAFIYSKLEGGIVKIATSFAKNIFRNPLPIYTVVHHNETANSKNSKIFNQNVSGNFDKNFNASKPVKGKIIEFVVSVIRTFITPKQREQKTNNSNGLHFEVSEFPYNRTKNQSDVSMLIPKSAIRKNELLKHIKVHCFGCQFGRWPWQVSVEGESSAGWRHMCHGALIHNRVVLIPTFCIKHKRLPSIRVVNSHKHDYYRVISSLNHQDDGYQPQEIENAIRLTNIGSSRQKIFPNSLHHHGVSLLYLKRTMGVRPVRWNSKTKYYPKSHCFTEYNTPIKFLSKKKCRKYYRNKNSLTHSHFCARGSPCMKHTHLGSPLVCYRHGHGPLLVGISARKHSCKHHHPMVFEGISPYNFWISAHLTIDTRWTFKIIKNYRLYVERNNN